MVEKYDYSKVYVESFDPRKYLEEFYSTTEGIDKEGGLFLFGFDGLLEFVHLLPEKMDKALDFGCGPCVHGMLAVTDKIGSVIFADYVPANLLV